MQMIKTYCNEFRLLSFGGLEHLYFGIV
jgi:hypothetical protein